jgi:hypothetical protein
MVASYNTINNAVATGTIVAIVVGSFVGLVIFITIIVCIIKRSNRRNIAAQGMILQQAQPYPYPQTWQNQYPPNATSVANYPPMYATAGPPNTVNMTNYPQMYPTVGPPYTATAPIYN